MARQVVITGYSFRFPGQDDANFWENLLNERDLITEVDPGRWARENFLHPDSRHPGFSYTFSAGSIGEALAFDTGFFGISPREAAVMDPQQRILLELAWEAFENAGIPPSSVRGTNGGVYIGLSSYDYAFRFADDLAALDSSFATGNTGSIAANRLSYVFDLHGPSMMIDTACSSSLVAFHQACRSIVSGESDFALAGGVNLHLHPYGFVAFSKASMLSKKGRCRVFDASADGYVRSEGGGIFILKEFEKAVADGNPILAVVAGTSVNTDGHKSGITVPNPKAQADLLNNAYEQARIHPQDIDYIEMHGTGTAVGDPIENRAIGVSIGRKRAKEDPLPIGSVKSNLGHLEPASGVPGLVKSLLCIQHRTIPATIGLETPNPRIHFQDWNLEVVTRKRDLNPEKKITIGVNSFGFGGVNAHVILQSHHAGKTENPIPIETTPLPPLIISAKCAGALQQLAADYAGFLESRATGDYYDIAYSAAFHRDRHRHRTAIFGTSMEEIKIQLKTFAKNPETTTSSVISLTAPTLARGPAFIYSGNGAHWFEMGKHLLLDDIFLKSVREVDTLFQKYADFSLETELAGKNGDGRFEYTEIAQPALFALQVGITRMLLRHGLQPTSVAGHSVGEIAAAWAAGILTLPDAVKVIYYRSKLQGETKGRGEMTAVALGEAETRKLLEQKRLNGLLVIAGVNSLRGVTLAGNSRRLTEFETALAKEKILFKRLALDYAFHSPAMDPIQPVIKKALAALKPGKGKIPFFSTVTGTRVDGDTLTADYWWRNLRNPVLFQAAVRSILERGDTLFIEIGPHNILSGYINEELRATGTEGRVFATLRRNLGETDRVRQSARQAMTAGAAVAWERFFPFPGKFVPLPNYPWQKEPLWLSSTSESQNLLDSRQIHPLLGRPLKQHEMIWENLLDTRGNTMLADHVVGGTPVFPGTGYVELFLAAAIAWHPDDEVVDIEELEILNPLMLSDQNLKKIRVSIAPGDAGIQVVSRDYACDDPWVLHAKGRILLDSPGKILQLAKPPSLPVRVPDFSSENHYSLTRAAGLDYGPAFRCIRHGWVRENQVTAVFDMPDSVRCMIDSTHMHPGLLDSAFQLIIHFLKQNMEKNPNMVFVPVKIGKTVFDSKGGSPHLVHASLLKSTPHSLKVEFTVFDKRNNPVAVLKETRFRAIPLNKTRQENLELIGYHGIPKPHPWTVIPAPLNPETLDTRIADMVDRHFGSKADCRYAGEIGPLMDTLCRQFVFETLSRLAQDGTSLSRKYIQGLQIGTPEIAPFIDYLIRAAEADHTLSLRGSDWIIDPYRERPETAREIWNILVADYPDFFPIIDLAGRVGLHLPSILTGKKTLPDLFSTQPVLSAPIRQSLGTGRRYKLGRIIQQVIRQSQDSLPAGRRFSVMEISHADPLFVKDAFRVMDKDRCNYTFVSDTTATLEMVSFLKEQYPGFESRLIGNALHIESGEPAADRPHLILLTLDFTSNAQCLEALNFARSRLSPGGTILLIGLSPSFWIDFTFGAHPGWTSSRHSAQYWQKQLAEHGLVSGNPIELSPGDLSDIFVLTARLRNETVVSATRQNEFRRTWIVLTDTRSSRSGLSQSLVRQLQKRKDHVRSILVEEISDYRELLSETIRETGRIDGILHLAGFLSSIDHSASPEFNPARQQAHRCTVAALAARACEETGTDTTLWIITNGAARHLMSGIKQLPGQRPDSMPDDSVLYGFARTMMNEAFHYSVRSLDITLPLNGMAPLVDAVIHELEQADDEQEVILDHNGERFVPRLRILPPIETAPPLSPDRRTKIEEKVTLGFQFPGQLRNLRWETRSQRPLEKDEVDIQVHATGLNFRDVMYSLGLLSDEAVENGFAGASLGLEFAGVIVRTGNESGPLSPGDRVAGFGPSCFANRITTKANAVSVIPEGMSFEAAATIPVVFLTVYYSLKHLANLKAGETILIHGGAGGIGIAAIQTARALGAEIHATAGTGQKRDFLRLLGVTHIYDSRSYDFAEEVLLQTGGRGVDIVLNSLAGEAINRNLQVLKPFGRFLELGKRDFYENTRIGLRPFRNNISYFGIDADQLMKENPDLTERLFSEVMELFAKRILFPLPCHVFEAEEVVDAFRYMQQARHIGKIVVTYRNGVMPEVLPSESRHRSFSAAGGTFLITGGLAGFGLKTAEWLADKGARHLVLISRRGPGSSEARTAIERLKNQGVDVLAVSCDVTDRHALEKLLETVSHDMPPLKGIVHAAVVIEDGLTTHMDQEQIYRVLAPKILGAQHLHQLTLDLDLEFFVLYSSATTLFGNPGQAGYVGANCWLESLARYRRDMGLPATCISWGAIDDVGFLARHQEIKDALQNRMGGNAIPSDAALDALDRLLAADRSGVGFLEFDWQALSRFLPGSSTPKFSEIARENSGKGREDGRTRDIRLRMNELSEDDFIDLLIEMLQAELGEILRIQPQKIDPVSPLNDLGLDSLMGVEMVAALESRFDIRLSAMVLRESRNLTRVAHIIYDKLKGEESTKDSFRLSGKQRPNQNLSDQPGVNNGRQQAKEPASRLENIRQIRSIIE